MQQLQVLQKQMAQRAQCAPGTPALMNVKHANKQFGDWSEIEELRRKLC
jgi:hypothetical protein